MKKVRDIVRIDEKHPQREYRLNVRIRNQRDNWTVTNARLKPSRKQPDRFHATGQLEASPPRKVSLDGNTDLFSFEPMFPLTVPPAAEATHTREHIF